MFIQATMSPRLGQGFNLLTGEAAGPALASFTELAPNPNTRGFLDRKAEVVIVNTLNDIDNTASFSAEVRARYRFFSGSASFHQDFKEHVTSESTHVFLFMPLLLKYYSLNNNTGLSPNALAQLQNDPTQFANRFGHQYVNSYLTGGVLMALASVHTESREEQKKVAGDLQATLLAVGRTRLNVMSQVRSLSNTLDIKIKYRMVGGNLPLLTTSFHSAADAMANFINVMRNFETDIIKNPATVAIELLPYETLGQFPIGLHTINIEDQKRALAIYTRADNVCLTYINEIAAVLSTPENYMDPPAAALLERWKQYFVDKRNALQVEADACAKMRPHQIEDFTEILPPRGLSLPIPISYISPEESFLLGQAWAEKESSPQWTGLWVRQGLSRDFEATWAWNGKRDSDVDSRLRIRINPNSTPNVMVTRTAKKSGTAPEQRFYTGNFEDRTRRSIKGTHIGTNGTFYWNATISPHPNITAPSENKPEIGPAALLPSSPSSLTNPAPS